MLILNTIHNETRSALMETSKTVTVPVETVGQAYLEVLRARGI
ncbi:MAG: hypothetical protein HW419_279 [Deltaproteobacteria bacterium]|nr:hypothetical protein [Deltaproteobacteria bacterium]